MTQIHPVLPNFFIAGAPKAGTTSLYHYLDQHPEIYMSPVKEPNYFASEIRIGGFSAELQEQARRDQAAFLEYLAGPMTAKRFGALVERWDDYIRLFRNATSEQAIGEASVCYLWSRTAASRIAARIPRARIVLILRDPAERAFSQYLHSVSNGWTHRTFREEVEASLRSKSGRFEALWPFLDLGLYHEQVARFLRAFPPDSVCISLYEEWRTDFARSFRRILAFLNVAPAFTPDTGSKYLEAQMPRSIRAGYLLKKYGIWARAKSFTPRALRPLVKSAVVRRRKSIRLEPQDRAFLVAFYRDDILRLSSLLDRDLSSWLR